MGHSLFKLSLPLKARFVGVARLTVSGIASRAGFNFDSVEDIKVSVSEVCNRLIKDREGKDRRKDDALEIEFEVTTEFLKISFTIGGDRNSNEWPLAMKQDDAEEFGLMIAQVLMDEFEVNPREGCVVSMVKYISEVS